MTQTRETELFQCRELILGREGERVRSEEEEAISHHHHHSSSDITAAGTCFTVGNQHRRESSELEQGFIQRRRDRANTTVDLLLHRCSPLPFHLRGLCSPSTTVPTHSSQHRQFLLCLHHSQSWTPPPPSTSILTSSVNPLSDSLVRRDFFPSHLTSPPTTVSSSPPSPRLFSHHRQPPPPLSTITAPPSPSSSSLSSFYFPFPSNVSLLVPCFFI